MAYRTFQRGTGVFTCECCGRRTRMTTQSVDHLCATCYDLAGYENMVFDGCFDSDNAASVDQLVREHVKNGVPAERVAKLFPELMAKMNEGGR